MDSPLASASAADTAGPSRVGNGAMEKGSQAAQAAQTAPDAQQDEDLWSSILDSVQSSKAVPLKNLIIMGEPGTGKTTILSSLAARAPAGFISLPASSSSNSVGGQAQAGVSGAATGTPNLSGPEHDLQTNAEVSGAADFGMGYGYWDVGDEDGEDTLARVGVYQVPSSHPVHLSLLPFALAASSSDPTSTNPAASASSLRPSTSLQAGLSSTATSPKPSMTAIKDSLFMIVLDWQAPWTFLEQLSTWLDVVRGVLEDAENAGANVEERARWTKERALADELREQLEAYIRSYAEPAQTTDGVQATAGPNPALTDPSLPLGEGVLEHNWGVPLVIVCTKADTIPQLERDREFKEEQFDYIQQVLRTTCLKYGAGLFFTAQSRPRTFEVLRSYVLHRLFTPPVPARLTSATDGSHNRAADAGAAPSSVVAGGALSSRFPFTYRSSTIERDELVVPTGWDTWGKIKAHRDGFDANATSKGWEWDMLVEQVRRESRLEKGSKNLLELARQKETGQLAAAEDAGVPSAVRLYEDIISDWTAPAPSNNTTRFKQPDEQAFLAQHYANMSSDPNSRSKLSRLGGAMGASANGDAESSGRTVVGPMGSSSLSLPSVEKALLAKIGDADDGPLSTSARPAARMGRRESHREREGTPGLRPERLASPPLDSGRAGPLSPGLTSPEGPTSPGTPKQSEVLHTFFQSLLNKEKPAGMTPPSINRTRDRGSGPGGSGLGERRSSARDRDGTT
ncbi:DLIC-domain-containing protein [Ceraceosorus guamensis]|uniref:DLIC-domain-containing protein n=1 Tax=Ceraceosorus guamensis TaxID=1522189 RepID=A0A316VWQ5_9BASI|nr:DLIC-domain-containing protein [Ceraceosorus guamensis]PWN42077.1 DLIC-domain-containing protein [Ceraceosorus guamensis]